MTTHPKVVDRRCVGNSREWCIGLSCGHSKMMPYAPDLGDFIPCLFGCCGGCSCPPTEPVLLSTSVPASELPAFLANLQERQFVAIYPDTFTTAGSAMWTARVTVIYRRPE